MKMCMLLLASLFIVISPLNSDYTNMMKWLTENKAVISPKLSLISENEYNRYIITTEDVKSEEQLVFIPSNLFISINHDIIHPICKKVMGIGAHNSFNCLIYFLTIPCALSLIIFIYSSFLVCLYNSYALLLSIYFTYL